MGSGLGCGQQWGVFGTFNTIPSLQEDILISQQKKKELSGRKQKVNASTCLMS